jgi:hypothetical protein
VRPHHYGIIGAIVGIVIIFIALRIFAAGAREAGQGSCLTGCCMFDLGNSLMDLGCSLVGCGGVLACGAMAAFAVHLIHVAHTR